MERLSQKILLYHLYLTYIFKRLLQFGQRSQARFNNQRRPLTDFILLVRITSYSAFYCLFYDGTYFVNDELSLKRKAKNQVKQRIIVRLREFNGKPDQGDQTVCRK